MILRDITIMNFRGIRSLHLPLDELTVLIGENNTGKSTVLEAIRLVLTRAFGIRRGGQFTEYDFHLKDANATPQTADPIQITLHFAEQIENEWPDTVVQQLNEVVQLDVNGLNHIWLQTNAEFHLESALFEAKWDFLNSNGIILNLRNTMPINQISRFVPLFFLSALRDASQEFGQRGQFWSGFLKSVQLPDEQREQIEQMLRDVNTSLIDANAGLAEVSRKIADAGQHVPLDSVNPVVLEAIPTRVFDMVGKIQVHLKSSYGAKLPLNRHGEGTQSLAVIMLFQAFVAANLVEAYAPESTPILALEEPEAHLHPSAIRSFGSFLESMSGQILVSSHSGDLISRVPIKALRRLYKLNGETKVGQVEHGLFSDREIQALDYSIRLTKGHYLFSRCWFLVEGESDFHLMPLLCEALGYSQDHVNFSVIEYSQCYKKCEPFIKLAKAMGIQWFLMADGDQTGKDYISRAVRYLEVGENPADHARTLVYPDIEHEFWHKGYDTFMTNMVPATTRIQIVANAAGDDAIKTKQMITAAIKRKGGKPAFAHALMDEILRRGVTTIPQTIQDIITRIGQLGRG